MKCEKCNNNEANFHYRQTVNGETTEYHLCSDCAREEGFGDTLSYSGMEFDFDRMVNNMFGYSPFGMRAGLMSDMRPMLPGFGLMSRMMTPVFTPMVMTTALPQVEVSVEKEESEEKIPAGVEEQFNARREICALRHQLKAAVKNEEYEKAAELRDSIKRLEGKE